MDTSPLLGCVAIEFASENAVGPTWQIVRFCGVVDDAKLRKYFEADAQWKMFSSSSDAHLIDDSVEAKSPSPLRFNSKSGVPLEPTIERHEGSVVNPEWESAPLQAKLWIERKNGWLPAYRVVLKDASTIAVMFDPKGARFFHQITARNLEPV